MFPDKNVAMAIMQAYLQTKESGWINWFKGWQLKYDDDKKQLTAPKPESSAGKKFAACIDILKQISEAENKVSKWQEVLNAAHEAAELERKEAWTTSSIGLAETLDALRDYVLAELMEFDSFRTRRQGLFDDQTQLNLDIKTREENKDQYDPKETEELRKQLAAKLKETQPLLSPDAKSNRETFFNRWIKGTPKSKELGEQTFNDFVKHVKEGDHSLALCEAALGKQPTSKADNTATNLAEVSSTLFAKKSAAKSGSRNKNRSPRRGLPQGEHSYDTRSKTNPNTRRHK